MDFDGENTHYELVEEFELPQEFELEEIENILQQMTEKYEIKHKRTRVKQLFNLFNKFQLRRAMPKYFLTC